MKLHEMREITAQHVRRQKELIRKDLSQYGGSIMNTICSASNPEQPFGNLLILVNRLYSHQGTGGFIFTLQLIYQWQVKMKNQSWLQFESDRIRRLGHDVVKKYSIDFLSNTDEEVLGLAQALGRCPLQKFIACNTSKWPLFGIGAYFLIGLLMLGVDYEPSGARIIVLSE